MLYVKKITVALSSMISLLYIFYMHWQDHLDALCMHHMLLQENNRTCLSRLDALGSPYEYLVHGIGP